MCYFCMIIIYKLVKILNMCGYVLIVLLVYKENVFLHTLICHRFASKTNGTIFSWSLE